MGLIWPEWYEPPLFRGGTFMERASDVLGVSIWEIQTRSRKRHYSYRRFAIAHVMKDMLNYSYPQIAEAIGVKDHSSVIHGVRRSRELVNTSPEHAKMVNVLEMVA